jgi:hypothetical protein
MPKQLRLKLPVTTERMTSTERQWLLWAAAEWKVAHGQNLTIRWPRDIALIKPLLHLHGEEELKSRWRAYVRTIDEYLARKGWNVPGFSESIDRYEGDVDRVEQVRDFNRRQRERRDPLTGVRLRD